MINTSVPGDLKLVLTYNENIKTFDDILRDLELEIESMVLIIVQSLSSPIDKASQEVESMLDNRC